MVGPGCKPADFTNVPLSIAVNVATSVTKDGVLSSYTIRPILVPMERLELSWSCLRLHLKQVRMPFRHIGIVLVHAERIELP